MGSRAHGRTGGALEGLILDVLCHPPRYRGGYVPVWRILDALDVPSMPATIRWTLQCLEAQGLVERRRATPRQAEWRARSG